MRRDRIPGCGARAACALTALLVGVVLCPPLVFSQRPFYEGKTITIVRGGTPGGLGEIQARSHIAFLKKYIPGHPDFVLMHYPGAGGRRAANHVYNNVLPDGLTLGSLGGGLVIGPILALPGVNYDIDKLIYLGSPERDSPYVFYTKKEDGLSTLAKLRSRSGLRIGAQAVGHPIYYSQRIFALLLDLKEPRFVTGYSGRELDLAFMRGEADAKANTADTLFRGVRREWVEKDLLDFHATLTVPKGRFHPRFTDLPALQTFAKSDAERTLLTMFRSFLYARWPYFFPPGTPRRAVSILREAMQRTHRDPEFNRTFKRLVGRDVSPLSGDEVTEVIRRLPRNAQELALFRKIAGPGPLPAR